MITALGQLEGSWIASMRPGSTYSSRHFGVAKRHPVTRIYRILQRR